MQSVVGDANGGIASLINSQKSATGKASLTIYEFDTVVEKAVDVADINSCSGYTLVPRGGTALYDAVCRAIDETGRKFAAMPENERPGLVLVAVVTDGEENSSREYSFSQMKDRISTQQNVYNWKFSFLCSDPRTVEVARSAGVDCSVQYNNAKTSAAFEGTGGKFARMRSVLATSTCDVADISNTYNAQELEAMQ
jgi:hypothetical protein